MTATRQESSPVRPGERRRRSLSGVGAPIAASVAISAVFSLIALGRTASGGYLVTLFDDAMISMTYARNLADGEGLVWNSGQPAVEGYSNFLWTLLMVPGQVGLADRFAAVPTVVLGTAVLVVIVFLVHRIALELLPGRERIAVRAAWIVALLYPLSFWTLRGMEVGLVAALTCGAVLVALRLQHEWRAGWLWTVGALAAALVLTRDDAFIPAVIVLADVAWTALRRGDRRLLIPLAVFVAAVLGHEVFRLAVYGELVPNTYLLKVEGVALSTRLSRGFETLTRLDLLASAGLVVVAIVGARHVAPPRAALPLAVFGASVIYSVGVGGDAWEWMPFPNRYVTATLPLLAPFIAAAMDRHMESQLTRRVASALVVIGLAFPVVVVAAEGIHHLERDERWARCGLAVRAETDPGTTIAIGPAGNIAFFARRPAIDLFGKSDPVVARGPHVFEFNPGHSKLDLDYSVGQLRPPLVLKIPNATSAPVREAMEGWGYVNVGALWYLPSSIPEETAPILVEQGC